MRRIFTIVLFFCSVALYSQQVARFVGTVKVIRAEANEIDVKPDNGEVRVAKLIPESIFQRVAPGEKDLKQAAAIQLTDVEEGDRVLAVFEPGTNNLRRLVVMPASDIAKRNEADRLDWTLRGISGVVAAKTANEITLKLRSMMGTETQALVAVNDKTTYRRYAPDSVKFAEAKISSIADVGVGDQLRARGVKSDDSSKVAADEIVFGSFVTKAGKIAAVDADKKQISILEVGSNQPLLIHVAADSQLKQMPSFPVMGGPPGGMAGGPPAGMRAPDLAQMLEHMPLAKLEDLKPGDTVVVSSTKGAVPGEITAITLLSNAGMLIQMASMQRGARAGGASTPGQMPSGGGMSGGAGMSGGLEGLQLPGMTP